MWSLVSSSAWLYPNIEQPWTQPHCSQISGSSHSGKKQTFEAFSSFLCTKKAFHPSGGIYNCLCFPCKPYNHNECFTTDGIVLGHTLYSASGYRKVDFTKHFCMIVTACCLLTAPHGNLINNFLYINCFLYVIYIYIYVLLFVHVQCEITKHCW